MSDDEHLVVPLADLPPVHADEQGWLVAGGVAVTTTDDDPARAWATALAHLAAAVHLAVPPGPAAGRDVLDDVAVAAGAAPSTPQQAAAARARVRDALAAGGLHVSTTDDPTP